MKKTPRKKRIVRRKREKTGRVSERTGELKQPEPKTEAERLGAEAKAVYSNAHELDAQAHALHRSIRRVRRTGSLSVPGMPTAGPEIVTAEEQGSKGQPFPIVGIGASAGGYEAFAEFLQHLPKETGMAYVLVQHLDPKHKSQLSDLLARSTRLPVLQAGNNMKVQPERIYVIPENMNMTLEKGKLRLTVRKEHETPAMPIDLFFRSLAQEQQTRAIGVVLSGTGSDGTLGIEAIKGEGGITFAQDDRSSKYHGMPGSAIATGAVDFVLPPARIAEELMAISQHPLVGSRAIAQQRAGAESAELDRLLREKPNEVGTLFRLLRARTGVDFSLYKQSTLKRRIIRRMILHKKETLAQYIGLVEGSALELDALFNDLLINVTGFFRDPKTFQVLKKKIFPRILKAHADDSPLRLWVCGCSTGEEAYSLAMALVEYFDQTRTHCAAQVFATDVSNAAIEKARAGVYPPNIQQDVSPERLRRFFTKVDGKFQVHKSIRDMCVFARQNVVVDPPFSNLDLVSCRNVLIYFGPALQRRVVPLFHYSLRNGGFLLLGNSETIGASTEHFALLDRKQKIYARKATFARPGFDVAARPHGPELRETAKTQPGAREHKPLDLQQHIDKLLLRDFSPATVVVNSQMDVVHFRGRTGLYVEHAPGSASLSLFKMLRENVSVSVRAALSKAAREDAPVKQSGIEVRRNGDTYELTVEVVPFTMDALDERFYALIFRESRRNAGLPPLPGSKRHERQVGPAAARN